MKILQICFRVPFPPHDGGAIAMYNITKGLSEAGHDVDVLAFNTPKHFQNDNVLNGVASLRTVFVNTEISFFKAAVNLFKPLPYNIERFISKKFESALENMLLKKHYDVVHFEGLYTVPYVDFVKNKFNIPVVLRTHNLEYLIWKRLASNERNPLKKIYLENLSTKLKKFEKENFPKFNSIAAISKEDADLIKQLSEESNVKAIPAGTTIPNENNIVDASKNIFMISAMEWQPNIEGFWWFMKNIWPQLSIDVEELQFLVAGKRTPEDILELNISNVNILGFVDDATTFMKSNGLMLVPLLSGSGTRIKIIEGMAAGKCILTTKVGAEGTEYINGENIVIADSQEEWVNIIKDYYHTPEKYEAIGRNAYKWAKENYSISRTTEELVNLYKELL